MHPVLFHLGTAAVASHSFFIGVGALLAGIVVLTEARRQRLDSDLMLVAVAGGLVGGAIGMRLAGWLRYVDPGQNPPFALAWQYGVKSVLGGLTGAYLGVLVGKRLMRSTVKTGDVFAPGVALGMAVGRIGCYLAEAPGRVTSLPWGVHAPASIPDCAGCVTGTAMHPSFLYEIAFHLVAFAVLLKIRSAAHRPGELLTLYLMSYTVFRFAVEFVRANEVVALGLTRSQWFLLAVAPLIVARFVRGWRRGWYAGVPAALFRRPKPRASGAPA